MGPLIAASHIKMPKITMLPMFVKGKTPDELILAMLDNNLKFQKQFQYFDIQKQDGFWIAWFLDDITYRMSNVDTK